MSEVQVASGLVASAVQGHDLLYYAKGFSASLLVLIWGAFVDNSFDLRYFDRLDLVFLAIPYACIATLSLWSPEHKLWFLVLATLVTALLQSVYSVLNR